MSKVWVISSLVVVSVVFLYSMTLISNLNKCSWVREYECQKQIKPADITEEKYKKLNDVSRIFLNQCKPDIAENKNEFTINYSKCNLKVWVYKDKDWIKSVNLNWKEFTRNEIDNSFKK